MAKNYVLVSKLEEGEQGDWFISNFHLSKVYEPERMTLPFRMKDADDNILLYGLMDPESDHFAPLDDNFASVGVTSLEYYQQCHVAGWVEL